MSDPEDSTSVPSALLFNTDRKAAQILSAGLSDPDAPCVRLEVVHSLILARSAMFDRPVAERPRCLLIDLSEDEESGRELLIAVKTRAEGSSTPVIILADKATPGQVEASYAAGANAVMVKGEDVGVLWRQLSALANFWFLTATLPQEASPETPG